MRRTPLLLVFAAVAAVLLPVPVLAAPCSETAPVVRFDANPKTDVAVGSETRFSFKFNWSADCSGGVLLGWEVHDVSGGTDLLVRSNPGAGYDMEVAGFRGTGVKNWDFNATAVTGPGQHQFRARVLLDDLQISESSSVTVTGAGAAPTGGPATSGGEGGPVQAGPVPLEVTIGDYASAADIPSYVAALYRYGLGIGATLAMVMVVVGGFQYVVSRGNTSEIGAAKSRITNAVLGLLLLLGSFTLLQTINPELVSMRNIIIPPMQRVETISNKCEEFNREEFIVTPTSGRCGEKGTVSRSDGVGVANSTCTWGTCSGAEPGVCVVRGSEGPGCVVCSQVIDNQLENWGLTQTDAACNRFSPANVGTVKNDCMFAQDSRFDINDDVCALVTVDCSTVHSCGDYDAQLRARHGSTTLDMEGLLIDQHGGGSVGPFLGISRIFSTACKSNPCGVSTGCYAEMTTKGSIAHAIGGTLPGQLAADLMGDMWDCKAGAAPPPIAPSAAPLGAAPIESGPAPRSGGRF